MNIHLLNKWIEEMLKTKGADLFRYKGILAVKGSDKKFVFQGIHMLFDGQEGDVWLPPEKRVCKFVFIGRNLDRAALTEGFHACLVTKPLRFAVGDKVECRTARGWTSGEIIRLWDESNAYRVRVPKNEVWAPIDDDAFVRARRS